MIYIISKARRTQDLQGHRDDISSTQIRPELTFTSLLEVSESPEFEDGNNMTTARIGIPQEYNVLYY